MRGFGQALGLPRLERAQSFPGFLLALEFRFRLGRENIFARRQTNNLHVVAIGLGHIRSFAALKRLCPSTQQLNDRLAGSIKPGQPNVLWMLGCLELRRSFLFGGNAHLLQLFRGKARVSLTALSHSPLNIRLFSPTDCVLPLKVIQLSRRRRRRGNRRHLGLNLGLRQACNHPVLGQAISQGVRTKALPFNSPNFLLVVSRVSCSLRLCLRLPLTGNFHQLLVGIGRSGKPRHLTDFTAQGRCKSGRGWNLFHLGWHLFHLRWNLFHLRRYLRRRSDRRNLRQRRGLYRLSRRFRCRRLHFLRTACQNSRSRAKTATNGSAASGSFLVLSNSLFIKQRQVSLPPLGHLLQHFRRSFSNNTNGCASSRTPCHGCTSPLGQLGHDAFAQRLGRHLGHAHGQAIYKESQGRSNTSRQSSSGRIKLVRSLDVSSLTLHELAKLLCAVRSNTSNQAANRARERRSSSANGKRYSHARSRLQDLLGHKGRQLLQYS